jgi:hypothetical protein
MQGLISDAMPRQMPCQLKDGNDAGTRPFLVYEFNKYIHCTIFFWVLKLVCELPCRRVEFKGPIIIYWSFWFFFQ